MAWNIYVKYLWNQNDYGLLLKVNYYVAGAGILTGAVYPGMLGGNPDMKTNATWTETVK